MTDDTPAATTVNPFARLAGTWQGTSKFRMMPTDEFQEAPATALVTAVAGGNAVVLTYTWVHPEDGPQEGVLLIGSGATEDGAVDVAWGDSWHQQPAIAVLSGTLTGANLEVSFEYGGGWGWAIAIDGGEPLRLTMDNVIPAEHATPEIDAGPYPVMVAELRRDG